MQKHTLAIVRLVSVQCIIIHNNNVCLCIKGARWQDGAGAGSGEDMELFFSYISRWSPSTKYMLAYRTYMKHYSMYCTYNTGREDFLIEAVRFWNQHKIDSLPQSLTQRLRKVYYHLSISIFAD